MAVAVRTTEKKNKQKNSADRIYKNFVFYQGKNPEHIVNPVCSGFFSELFS